MLGWPPPTFDNCHRRPGLKVAHMYDGRLNDPLAIGVRRARAQAASMLNEPAAPAAVGEIGCALTRELPGIHHRAPELDGARYEQRAPAAPPVNSMPGSLSVGGVRDAQVSATASSPGDSTAPRRAIFLGG